MWGFIKAIIGLFIICILCMNFLKAVAIGNALFDKAYQLVVTKSEKVDSININ
jgi:hypothetical protein